MYHRHGPVPFISLCVLAYLSLSDMVIAGPTSVRPRQAFAGPNSTATQPAAGSATTTYNYWWPFPPAGGTTAMVPITALSPTTIAEGQITLILPIPPTPSFSVTSGNSSTSASPTSLPPPSTALSSASASSPANGSNDSEHGNPKTPQKGKFNIMYLVPFFSILGFVSLIGTGWLIYGCCTRKPKDRFPYAHPIHPPRSNYTTGSAETIAGPEFGHEKAGRGVGTRRRETSAGTFKAFRYEDFVANSDHRRSLQEADWELGEDAPIRTCEHVRDYGFECDCRQSLIEHQENQFFWPSMRVEDTADEDEPDTDCEGHARRPKHHSIRTRVDRNMWTATGAVFTPLDVSPDYSDLECTPGPDEGETYYRREGYFDARERKGRQQRLLDSVWSQDKQRQRLPRSGAANVLRKNRRTVKSTKSVKSTKTNRITRTERDVYSDDGSEASERGRGFKMMVESPYSMPGDKGARILSSVVASSRGGNGEDGEGWMGKMASVIGSTISRLSGGNKDEDRYTTLPRASDPALPSLRSYRHYSQSKRHHHSRDARGGCHVSPPTRPLPSLQNPRTREGRLNPRQNAIGSTLQSKNQSFEKEKDSIEKQRQRLQSHRESIASLPAGMMFSPPLVGISVFGEETGRALGASESLSRVER